MTEVEKLYKLAGIKKQYCGWLDMGDLDTQYTYVRCDSLEEFNDTATMSRTSYSSEEEDWDKPSIEYPPFTAEKQIEIYKYLCKPFLITTRYYFDEFSITAENTFEWKPMTKVSATDKIYEECIAKLVNNLWQSLTEEERKQIKNILE